MKNNRQNKGITLIALIITIIVMLILVAVTVAVALQGGLFNKAKTASKGTEEKAIYETIVSAMKIDNNGNIDAKATGNKSKEILTAEGKPAEFDEETGILTVKGKLGTYSYTITDKAIEIEGVESEQTKITDDLIPTKSYIGYYANLDDDPTTAEGIIYVDLMKGANNGQVEVSGKWGNNSDGSYSYKTIEESKAYSVSKTNYTEGKFGQHPIISVKDGSTGNDRFYVMALSDVDGGALYTWNKDYSTNSYYIGPDYIESTTTTQVAIHDATGKSIGRRNTEIIMNVSDLTGNPSNLWNHISTQVASGWYVPSRAEWSAFGDFMWSKIEGTGWYGMDPAKYGLSGPRFSSSQATIDSFWLVKLSNYGKIIDRYGVMNTWRVRLGTTF